MHVKKVRIRRVYSNHCTMLTDLCPFIRKRSVRPGIIWTHSPNQVVVDVLQQMQMQKKKNRSNDK